MGRCPSGMGLSPLSAILIGLQFVLIGLIIWPFGQSQFGILSWLCMVAGVAFGLYVLAHNRIGNFNIRPEVKAAARLITTGPYRYLRHPMYSALLLFLLAWIVAANGPTKFGLWISLLLVLSVKASYEEQFLRQHFSEYSDYEARTKRFIPFLW